MKEGIYLSQPWEVLSSRKGDPLGFQNIANQIADEIAPGLSGRTYDARWLTLLCKGLTAINPANSDNEILYQRFCLWERGILAHALNMNDAKGRQLPGKTKVEIWPPRYRYYGPYGCYKKLMISIGLVEEDGWTLRPVGEALAEVIGRDLIPHIRIGKKPINTIKSDEKRIKKWLPRREEDQLSRGEINNLAPLLFGDTPEGKILRQSFRWMRSGIEGFWSLKKDGIPGTFCQAFAEFSSACLAAIKEYSDSVWLSQNRGEDRIEPIDDWKQVIKTARNLQKINNNYPKVYQLVESVLSKSTDPRVLIDHHIYNSGSGQKWLAKPEDCYISLAGGKAKMLKSYSFRLYSLWRLGKQLIPTEGPNEYPWKEADPFEEEE